MDRNSPQGGCIGEESEDECTSRFFVGDLQIIAKDVSSYKGDATYFVSNPKEVHKSYLQSPLEPHNEEEDKATPLGCERGKSVEEKATIVSLHEEGNIKDEYDKSYDFCSSHV